MDLPSLKNLYAPKTLVFGAVNGLVTLIPIHRAPAWQKTVLIAAPGVLAASLIPCVLAKQRADERPEAGGQVPEEQTLLHPRAVGASAAVGGLASGSMALGLVIDGAIERFLHSRGVRRPRVVMAAAGTVIAVAAEYLDSGDDADEARSPEAEAPASPEDDTEGSAFHRQD